MLMYFIFLIFGAAAETTQNVSMEVPAPSTSMSAVEMAQKYCSAIAQSTRDFRQSINSLDQEEWKKEMATFSADCGKGFHIGFSEASSQLPRSIRSSDAEKWMRVVETQCHGIIKRKNPKAKGYTTLHQNMGCVTGGYSQIHQRLATK
jgi:nitrate/TMAO reductase-like tetraheme cytochrome c subunit